MNASSISSLGRQARLAAAPHAAVGSAIGAAGAAMQRLTGERLGGDPGEHAPYLMRALTALTEINASAGSLEARLEGHADRLLGSALAQQSKGVTELMPEAVLEILLIEIERLRATLSRSHDVVDRLAAVA